MFTLRTPRARRLLVGAIAVPVAIAVTATAAHADTSTASASAVNLSLFGTPIPGPATVSNDGSLPVQTAGFPIGGIALLVLVKTGVLKKTVLDLAQAVRRAADKLAPVAPAAAGRAGAVIDLATVLARN